MPSNYLHFIQNSYTEICVIDMYASFTEILLFQCILAAIIIVAVKPLLLQALQFPRIWKMSKMNGIIWLITFLTVVVVDIGIGLLTGIATSIVVICIQCFRPNSCVLGVVPDTEIYLNVAIYKEVNILLYYIVLRIMYQMIFIYYFLGPRNRRNKNLSLSRWHKLCNGGYV